MKPTIRLCFRYQEDDYVRAMRAHFALSLRLPLDLTVLAVVAGMGVYYWGSGRHGLRSGA